VTVFSSHFERVVVKEFITRWIRYAKVYDTPVSGREEKKHREGKKKATKKNKKKRKRRKGGRAEGEAGEREGKGESVERARRERN